MHNAAPNSRVLTGGHVLLALVLFFAVVFAVNAYFITVALSTYSGVVANEPYRKGLRYNERITADERQHELGWTDEISLAPDGGSLSVVLRGRDGEPIRSLKVTGRLGRPATTSGEVPLMLDEAAPGRYETTLLLDGNGAFVASIEAQDGASSVVYRARKRLWLER